MREVRLSSRPVQTLRCPCPSAWHCIAQWLPPPVRSWPVSFQVPRLWCAVFLTWDTQHGDAPSCPNRPRTRIWLCHVQRQPHSLEDQREDMVKFHFELWVGRSSHSTRTTTHGRNGNVSELELSADTDFGQSRFGQSIFGQSIVGAPEGWGPKISRFFPSPATIFFLSPHSWRVLSWNFGGV